MITFSAVTKRFGDGTVALDSISFHIESGELVVITGPSGSGKTTLMRLLIRDFLPTEGSIFYKGESIVDMRDSQVPFHRRKIGVVFQDYRLLSELNVWENIALPLSILGKSESEIESRVTDLLNLVSLTDRALVFPKQLSGGEAQRVSIARALATGPNLIFADEPTGNLDKKASLSIIKLLQQISALGTTVLVATHDVTLLDYLENERQIDLDHGKLAHDSRPGVARAPQETPPEKTEEKAAVKTAVSSEEKPEEKPADKPAEKQPEPAVSKKTKKKSAKKEKPAKETKPDKETSLADEFQQAATEKPAEKKSSWLKKLGGGIPSIKLPIFGRKPPKEEEKTA